LHLRADAAGRRLRHFQGGDDASAAEGFFVHVYVDRETRRPTPLPAVLRKALERL